MSVKKIIIYGRYVMLAVLDFYLILVWMYFKDNALQLTSKSLLLWFVLIPLVIVASIITLIWQQKRLQRKASVPTPSKNKEQAVVRPDIYTLFIKSSICLPEGQFWAEVIDNDDDLTVLSTDLQDFDGLPILTKPIAYLVTERTLHDEVGFNDEDTEEQAADLDSLTLRLSTLIEQQLSVNEDALSLLAEHFNKLIDNNNYEPNSAIHIHPEWQ